MRVVDKRPGNLVLNDTLLKFLSSRYELFFPENPGFHKLLQPFSPLPIHKLLSRMLV